MPRKVQASNDRRLLLAKVIHDTGVTVSKRCSRCELSKHECRVDFSMDSSSRCSRCVANGRSCNLVVSEDDCSLASFSMSLRPVMLLDWTALDWSWVGATKSRVGLRLAMGWI